MKRRETALTRIKEMKKGYRGEQQRIRPCGNRTGIRGWVESVFYPSHLGVSQEEVQKKPQPGTTQ
jgi:hypothetical protein